MQDLLRGIVVGLGVLLGIIHTDQPMLSMYVTRDDAAITVNIAVDRAFPPEAVRLLDSGNTLEMAFDVEAQGYGSFHFSHRVGYDLINRTYTIQREETGETHATDNRDAAINIASEVYAYRLMNVTDFDDKKGLTVEVSCDLKAPDMDADVVWNYHAPHASLSFAALSGIPR